MAKVRIVLHKGSKIATPTESPVVLYVSKQGERLRLKTGFSGLAVEDGGTFIEEEGRFKAGQGISTYTVPRRMTDGIHQYTNKDANAELAKMQTRADDIITEWEKAGSEWTITMLREELNPSRGKKLSSFKEYAETRVLADRYEKMGQYRTAQVLRYTLISFENWDTAFGRKKVQDINATYLNKYIADQTKMGIKPNTISIRLRAVRKVLNFAIEDKCGSNETYPFGGKNGVKIPSNKTMKRFVPMDGLRAIAATEMKNPATETARHLFLLSFHLRGMNYEDMAKMRRSNIVSTTTKDGKPAKMLIYRRSKTGGDFQILITPTIQKELDWFATHTKCHKDYLLPIVSQDLNPDEWVDYINQRRKRHNRQLKAIATQLGIDAELTGYWARHSFAQAMLTKGESVARISQALGHADTKTTQIYLAGFDAETMAEHTEIEL